MSRRKKHDRRPSNVEQERLDNAVEIFGDNPEELKKALKEVYWELALLEPNDDDDDDDDDNDDELQPENEETDKLKEEIERLNLQYGDEVLANIQLNHEKRASLQLAARWKEEAEKLREQLDLLSFEEHNNHIINSNSSDSNNNNNNNINNNDNNDNDNDNENLIDDDNNQTNFIDDDDFRDNSNSKETPGNDFNLQNFINIFDSDEERTLTVEEKNEKLQKNLQKIGYELGDTIMKNTELVKEKRESLVLVEQWKKEAMELRKLLQENSIHPSDTNDENDIDSNSINHPNNKVKQLETQLLEKEKQNKKLKHERRESLVAIQSYKEEVEELRSLLQDGGENIPYTKLNNEVELGINMNDIDNDEEDETSLEDNNNNENINYKNNNNINNNNNNNIINNDNEIDLLTGDKTTDDGFEQYFHYVTPNGNNDSQFENDLEKAKLKSEVERLNVELADTRMQNQKYLDTKRQSEIEFVNLQKENKKLTGLLNNSRNIDDNEYIQEIKNNHLNEINKIKSQFNEKIEFLRKENNRLILENKKLCEDKLKMIDNTNIALNQSREYVRMLGLAIRNKQFNTKS